MSPEKNEMSFETALSRVEEITDKMSNEELSLDESVELYAEAMKLMSYCKAKLEDATRKISIVSDKNMNILEKYRSEEE